MNLKPHNMKQNTGVKLLFTSCKIRQKQEQKSLHGLSKGILTALLLPVLASCTPTPCKDLSDVEQDHQETITEIKKPDAVFLAPCKLPTFPQDDSLESLLTAFDNLSMLYSDCYKRHNALVKQL
jgi:hypothetical protein